MNQCLLLFVLFHFLHTVTTQDSNETLSYDEPHHRERRGAINFYQPGTKLARQISTTLDRLLGPSYNKRVRPMFGGPPVVVELNLSIRSISFFVDCYFRQSWYDDRLTFNTSGVSELPLNWKLLPKLWKPDTFFVNGKKSKLHKITVPNRFLRISPQGRVSYSQRLTVHARCPMSLIRFPLDHQMCKLEIGSYGYTEEEVRYQWKSPSPISLDELSLAQFHMVHWEAGLVMNTTKRKIESGFRNDSIAYLHFFFERQMGFFLLQVYTPLFMMVMCSWVAFWIVKSDAAGRCSLGVTTVLSTIKLGFGEKGKPQVGYPTALDIFSLICLCSVFAALVEYAIISFISLYIKAYKEREAKLKEETAKQVAMPDLGSADQKKDLQPNPFEDSLKEDPEQALDATDQQAERPSSRVDKWLLVNAQQLGDWLVSLLPKLPPVPEMYIYKNTEEALDRIDDESKKYFPLVFFTMMAIYWSVYVFLIVDDIPKPLNYKN